jgi:hypothetical protein
MSQIIDLFPMLKELYNKGAQDAFYVVKVWVKKSIHIYLTCVFSGIRSI